jgi:hypothetical protein
MFDVAVQNGGMGSKDRLQNTKQALAVQKPSDRRR